VKVRPALWPDRNPRGEIDPGIGTKIKECSDPESVPAGAATTIFLSAEILMAKEPRGKTQSDERMDGNITAGQEHVPEMMGTEFILRFYRLLKGPASTTGTTPPSKG